VSYQAFSMVPTRAVMDQSLGHSAFRVLAILASYRNSENGWCWPSARKIAEALGISEASAATHVSKAIKELRDKGYIRHIAGYGRTVSRYQVILDQEDPGPQQDEDAVDSDPTLFVELDSTKLVDPASTKIVDQTRLYNKKKEPNEYSADFEEFWAIYPKKVGKLAAFKEWKEAVRRRSAESITKRAAAYAADPARKPGYTLDPERWLKKGRYEDPYPQENRDIENGHFEAW